MNSLTTLATWQQQEQQQILSEGIINYVRKCRIKACLAALRLVQWIPHKFYAF